jgi:peptidoglycan/xylan/chitin deacetylase (PgdA/CDA1 family)
VAMNFAADTLLANTSHNGTSSAGRSYNDALSFWKLPEQWEAALEPLARLSQPPVERLLFEERPSITKGWFSRALRFYYPLKPLIPSKLRHSLKPLAIRLRGDRGLPQWPCDNVLLEFWRTWLNGALEAIGERDGYHIGFWPQNKSCCIVLTHDVDSRAGFERMEQIAEIEERHGFRSAWNLPLAQYPIDWKRVEALRARGFEIGAHGLSHDGRLFRSKQDFDELAPMLQKLASEHALRGFRSPSTLRNPKWISSMAFDFDSSFADTDPYEPQPGGTCSLFPYFLSRMVELPYTLPQDHTLIYLVRRSPLPLWMTKARWIASVGGMILALTHPDYLIGRYLNDYEELVKRLADFESAWRALPSEAAGWWTERAHLRLLANNGQFVIAGPGCERAVVRPLAAEPLARGN